MAYQMSPAPTQTQNMKPPPQAYPPPYQGVGSPPAQSPFAQPPAKRQRLSPDPRSPAASSPMYAQSPVYGNQQYGSQQGAQSPMPYSPQSYASPQSAFNTPQPYSPPVQWHVKQPQQQQRSNQISPPPAQNSSQMMPPPPRPNKEDKDERIGIDEIGDSLFGSGINLKDEENYLQSTWNNRHSQNESFNATQTTSFGSNTMSPGNSFNMLTQGTSFGSQGTGTLGQERSQDDIENEMKRKRAEAARRKAETDQHHLNNQFLQGNCLRHRMQQRAIENGVRLDVNGVYVRNPEPAQSQTQVMTNGDGTEGIVSTKTKPEAMIEAGSTYDHIISLVSLASAERLRGLMDEAYGLARARRYGDHGRVVPPEFADIATGEGKQSQDTVIPESITGSQWDKPQDSVSQALNGEVQTNGEKTPTPQPVQTVSFQSAVNKRLLEIAARDRQAEKERQKKREARRRKAENEAENAIDASAEAAPAAEAPPVIVAPAKISKKEQNKKAKEAQQNNEAQAFNESNQTAALMMTMGRKKPKYSWMTGGASSMPVNRFAKTGSGTSTPKAQAEPAKAATGEVAKKEEEKKAPTWGDWREDDVHGRGIQLRDWTMVLERDGREKKALEKALAKLA